MAFLGIKIPLNISKLLKTIDIPGEKIDTSDMHITILCFEDDLPIEFLSKAVEATYEAIKNVNSFKIKLNKVSCFPPHDEQCAIIAPVISNELQDICQKLRKSFDKYDLDYKKNFKEYKPHITLAYNDKEIKNVKIPIIECDISEIMLFSGDRGLDTNNIVIFFPLQNKKYSELITKSQLLQLISSKY
jgi:2'-5' RNA ligase